MAPIFRKEQKYIITEEMYLRIQNMLEAVWNRINMVMKETIWYVPSIMIP